MPKMRIEYADGPSVAPTQRPPSVKERTHRSADGTLVKINAIDANSPTFSEDLLWIFTENVKAARAENERLFGSPDGVEPHK